MKDIILNTLTFIDMMIKKNTLLYMLGFCVLLLTSFSTKDGIQKSKLRRIVIDAGHGGHDSGAPGK